MKTIENIVNYFTGKDAITYYNKLIKKFPKEIEDYKDKLYSQVIIGKITPNALNLAGIITTFTAEQPIYLCLIALGEVLRYNFYTELNEDKESTKKKISQDKKNEKHN